MIHFACFGGKVTRAGVVLALAGAVVLLARNTPAAMTNGPAIGGIGGPLNTNNAPLPPVRVRGAFMPLNKNARDQVITALKTLPDKYGTNRAPIVFNVVAGNNRLILAREMTRMLQSAGLGAQQGETALILPMPADSVPGVFIKCNASESAFASNLAEAFTGLLMPKMTIVNAPEWSAGRIEIFIYGDPVFSSTGTVTFK